jgi:hypothetical protein
MKRSLLTSIILFGLLFSQTGLKRDTVKNDRPEKFMEAAAKKMNCQVADLRIDPADLDFYGSGKYRLKTFDFLATEPLKVAPFTRVMARTLLGNADSLWFLAFYPWARIDEGVRRGLIARPDKAVVDSLTKITDLRKELGTILRVDYGAVTPDLHRLSDSLVAGLYLVLSEVANSIKWIRRGKAGLLASEIDSIVNGLIAEREDGLDNLLLERMIDKTDFKALAAGAMDLGYVLPAAIPYLASGRLSSPVSIETKYGKIVIGSASDDKYDRGPYLFVFDDAGNDEYVDAAITDWNHPVSVIVDLKGDDRYRGRIGPATGIAGYAFIIDGNGDDSYISEKIGLATGIFGEGVILDRAGDDFYSGDLYAQGAGLFGAGILADLDGNDEYACFQGGQGFGFVKGCGVLVDRTGDDKYAARDDTVRYPSPQTPEHNASLSQGMGFGVRADYVDGHSLAGGVGILVDGSGDDRYSCGVFGQGCAYWFGAGFLIDMEGDDEYEGTWYVQGAGAHFALGVLLDSCGSDRHILTMSMGIGAGHDFTLGCLFDYEGDDAYEGGALSLGAGNANGMGLFIDFQGDDEYRTRDGSNLGFATVASRGGLRDYMKCIGLFFDGSGNDRYREDFSGNRKFWIQEPNLKPYLDAEKHIGIDF